MASYIEELVEQIKDPEKWPEFDRPDFLAELNELADTAVSKKTVDGYLSALLIFQQLAEEMIKLVLKDHEFFIQLSVFPAEFKFPSRSKAMFGRVIEELKNTVTIDDGKFEMIDLASELNQIRIEIVHGLTRIPNLEIIESKVTEAKRIFDNLFVLFDREHDMFRLTFKDFGKDCDWGEELRELEGRDE